MDNRYIGVFDSGLGGLTAVKELMHQLPNEGIIYFGDTARLPYGTRSHDTIIKYVNSDINFLKSFDIKIIVGACGTASAVALEEVRHNYDVEIVGVVEPAVKEAVELTKSGKIGIIGTSGTINSGKYERVIKSYSNEFETVSKSCPLFVPLVENGHIDTEVAYKVAQEYLEPLIKANVDTIIMGCTHYPLLRKVIYDIMGDKVALIDPGAETAKHVKQILEEKDMLCSGTFEQQYLFFVSDLSESFEKMGSLFLERELSCLDKVDIEKY